MILKKYLILLKFQNMMDICKTWLNDYKCFLKKNADTSTQNRDMN